MNKYMPALLLALTLSMPLTARAVETAKAAPAQNPPVTCPNYEVHMQGQPDATMPCPMMGQAGMMNGNRPGWMMGPQGHHYNDSDWNHMHGRMYGNMPRMHDRMIQSDYDFNR